MNLSIKQNTGTIITLAVILFFSIVGGGRWWYNAGRPSVRVTSGTLAERIVVPAVVVARDGVAEVFPRLDGEVLTVWVRRGDTVRAGTLLAEISPEAAHAELARCE